MVNFIFVLILCISLCGCSRPLAFKFTDDKEISFTNRWFRDFKVSEETYPDGTVKRSVETSTYNPIPKEIPVMVDK